MKLLLCNPPTDGNIIKDYYCAFNSAADYYWPPQDLYALSGTLCQEFDLEILDAAAAKMSYEDAVARIERQNPDVLIVAMTPLTLRHDLEFLNRCRRLVNNLLVIASGGMFRNCAKAFLRAYPVVDAVLTYPLVPDIGAFIRDWSEGWTRDSYQGIGYRRNGAISVDQTAPITNNYSWPDAQHMKFPYEQYRHPCCRSLPFTILAGSVGCPFSCPFCAVVQFPFRYRSPENLLAEFEHAVTLGFKSIVFVDPTMNVSRKRLVTFCQGLIAKNLDGRWVANMRADVLDEKLVELLARSGCNAVMIGVESGDRQMRLGLKKPIDLVSLRAALHACREAGIETLGYFILGHPGEDSSSAKQTLHLSQNLGFDFVSFTILTVDWGTELQQSLIRQGVASPGLEIEQNSEIYTYPGYREKKTYLRSLRSRALIGFYLAPMNLLRRISHDAVSGRLWGNVLQGIALLRKEVGIFFKNLFAHRIDRHT